MLLIFPPGTIPSIVSNTHHPHVHNSYANVAAVAAAASTFAYASPSTLGHSMSHVSSTTVTPANSVNGQRSNVSHHHSSPGHHPSTGVISSSSLSRHAATSLLPYSAIYSGLGMTPNANLTTINSNSTELTSISNGRQLPLTHHQSPLLTPPPSSSDISRGTSSTSSHFKSVANRNAQSMTNLFSSPSSASSSSTDGQAVTPPSSDQLLIDSVGHSAHPSQTQTSSSASSLVQSGSVWRPY